MLSADILAQAEAVLAALRARAWRVVTAESCTGGLIAASLTHAAGASDVVECGFVTYSNIAKSELLGVPPTLIAAHGAVSASVARAMALGALARSQAHVAVSVTGIAGPGGGSVDKPVGLVWFGCAVRDAGCSADSVVFPGTRAMVRQHAVEYALRLLRSRADVAGREHEDVTEPPG